MSRVVIAILSVTLFLLGFVVSEALKKQHEEIATITMERRDIKREISISGHIEPERVIDVRSSISGTLGRLYVKVGDVVVPESPLASIRFVKDPIEVRRLRDNIEVSRKRLDAVTSQLRRTEALHTEGFMSDEEYEAFCAEYAAMKKNHETLVAELSMVTGERTKDMIPNVITATGPGTVIELPIKEGGSVMARGTYSEGSVIARIADFGMMVFEGEVSEVDVDKVKVGAPMEITVATAAEGSLRGTITSISPTATRARGIVTYRVQAAVECGKESEGNNVKLYSGCTANGCVVLESAASAWSLNEKYVRYEGDSAWVEIVNERGRVERRNVQLGISDGLYTEIVGGLDSLTLIKKIE